MINRRNFLKKSLFASAGLSIGASYLLTSCNKPLEKGPKEIIILHTNDQHSRIEPFPLNDPKHAGLGGFARRASLINKIRSEYENVLLLDCGDIFQGTPYFNLYNGSLEIELMNKMGYDASTIGNHEFDGGIENLANMIEKANFPFLCSNYDFSKNAVAGKTKKYKTFTFNGFKVGIFGLGIALDGLVDPSQSAETIFLDPLTTANQTAQYLKDVENCNYIIVLSHLGYQYENPEKVCDIQLAKNSENINLILGGHTHTLLEKPQVFNNINGQEVIVNQVGWAGINLGFLTLDFQRENPQLTSNSGKITIC